MEASLEAMPDIALARLGAAEAEAALDALAALLVDAVENGASVNFLAGFRFEEARAFWRGQLAAIGEGERVLTVARSGEKIVGTVVLTFAPQPNGRHRAEIGKMLVHSAFRRRGIGRALLSAGEQAAREAGKTLLVLDTNTGSEGDHLYRASGWREVGSIPGFALTTDGRPASATIFYKELK